MGFNMFKAIAALAAAVLMAGSALAQDYTIRPGDQLQIEVLEDPGLNRTVLVLPDGSISFPLAGVVSAGGQTIGGVRSTITSALAPNFAAPPTVTVSVTSVSAPAVGVGGGTRSVPVFVMGEVAAPGRADVQRGTTLLQFLAQSGGFSRFAATKRVQLIRTDPRTGQQSVRTFNYQAAERGSIGIGNTVLQSGDVIIVPERRLFE